MIMSKLVTICLLLYKDIKQQILSNAVNFPKTFVLYVHFQMRVETIIDNYEALRNLFTHFHIFYGVSESFKNISHKLPRYSLTGYAKLKIASTSTSIIYPPPFILILHILRSLRIVIAKT